jgi:hypothetical protein
MANKLQQYRSKIKKINENQILWLRLSGFVVISIFIVLLGWNFLTDNTFIYIIIFSGLILSCFWWYLTIKLIKDLLNHRNTEVEILNEIIQELKVIKEDVKKIS